MKNAGNLLGIEFHRNRRFLGAIQDPRNHTGDAHPARCILVELALAGLCCDHFLLSHTFLLTKQRANARLHVNALNRGP